MVGWVGPRTKGPFPRGFRPPGSLTGMAQGRTPLNPYLLLDRQGDMLQRTT